MASVVDKNTGTYSGINCHGEEKVRRYREVFKSKPIDEFYSDSYSDTPLAKIADKAFIVKGNKLSEWDLQNNLHKRKTDSVYCLPFCLSAVATALKITFFSFLCPCVRREK